MLTALIKGVEGGLLRRAGAVQSASRPCLGLSILTKVKPSTGEPDAGKPPVRFGGRGDRNQSVVPTPIIAPACDAPPVPFGTPIAEQHYATASIDVGGAGNIGEFASILIFAFGNLFQGDKVMERELWLVLYQMACGLDRWEPWKLGRYL